MPPPSTFSLPVPLINNIPSPSKAHPNAVLQRCIRWEWIDIDWHVRPDSHANTPVDAKSSETVDLSKQSSPPMNGPGGVADWARGKMAAATASSASSVHGRRGSWALGQTATGAAVPQPSSPQPSVKSGDLPVQEDDKDEGLSRLPKGASLESVAETEWIGDGQGWAYGDNSWDKMTSRQGMGKFTRRRVWVRRARVVESSRYIETGEDDVTSARKKSH